MGPNVLHEGVGHRGHEDAELIGEEAISLALLVLPFVILAVLVKILPPWEEARTT